MTFVRAEFKRPVFNRPEHPSLRKATVPPWQHVITARAYTQQLAQLAQLAMTSDYQRAMREAQRKVDWAAMGVGPKLPPDTGFDPDYGF